MKDVKDYIKMNNKFDKKSLKYVRIQHLFDCRDTTVTCKKRVHSLKGNDHSG